MIWRPSVRLSVRLTFPVIFLTLLRRTANTQRFSPGGSTRRGLRTFPSEYYEYGHTCLRSFFSFLYFIYFLFIYLLQTTVGPYTYRTVENTQYKAGKKKKEKNTQGLPMKRKS